MSPTYLFKIPVLILVMAAELVSQRKPLNYRPTQMELERFGRADVLSRITKWYPVSPSLAVPLAFHLCEIAAILARVYGSSLSDRILAMLCKDPSAADALAITPSFVLGSALAIAGGMLRSWSYDTLGRHFTYQLAILKDHKLITSGPYAVVRHPAYIGYFAVAVGVTLVQLSPGSYLIESGVLATPWVAAAAMLWVLWVSNTIRVLLSRVPKEDMVLREEFGSQWVEWAKKTPYRLIPHVY